MRVGDFLDRLYHYLEQKAILEGKFRPYVNENYAIHKIEFESWVDSLSDMLYRPSADMYDFDIVHGLIALEVSFISWNRMLESKSDKEKLQAVGKSIKNFYKKKRGFTPNMEWIFCPAFLPKEGFFRILIPVNDNGVAEVLRLAEERKKSSRKKVPKSGAPAER